METSTPLPEYVRIRDIAKRWNVEVPYIMQFQKEVDFLYGGLPETLTPYNPDEILREVANEAREKGADPLMAKLKFAENEIPKLEASMLWLHRDDVLRIERTHIITENLTLTERQGNKKGSARQDSASAFGAFLAQVGQAAIWLKVAEREAEKALQDSPTANRLLKRYAELTGQTKGKCEPMQSRHLLTDQVVTAQAEPIAPQCEINQERQTEQEGGAPAQTKPNYEKVLSELFDPVGLQQLEKMFPCGKWAGWGKKAKEKGLDAARIGRAKYNPYLAAQWWLTNRKPEGWDLARVNRVLANNLPHRSRDSKYLVMGELE